MGYTRLSRQELDSITSQLQAIQSRTSENKGFHCSHREGTVRGMTFQAAPVKRPLGAVRRMCRSSHRVVFDDDGSYIMNKTTGEVNWMREEDGNYILDLWVIPPKESSWWGFHRQS